VSRAHRDPHAFPTRRSSDLELLAWLAKNASTKPSKPKTPKARPPKARPTKPRRSKQRVHFRLPTGDVRTERVPHEEVDDFVKSLDRKSTRLNSSHLGISYAV